jgi:hypothetical protein
VCGGSVETLRSFLNVQSDADFVLMVAWALACLRNRGPYPVIVLSGEQGCLEERPSSGYAKYVPLVDSIFSAKEDDPK